MPVFTLLLCVLLSVPMALQRPDVHLVYVTHNSFFYYSCSQDPQPCSVSSLVDCRRKDVQLSTLHRPQLLSSPILRMRRLSVWFTSSLNTARLLNNSEVRQLTLIRCDAGGMPSSVLKGHFVVQNLEQLTVVNLPQRPDVIRAKSVDSNTGLVRESASHLDTNRYNRGKDTNLELFMNMKKDSLGLTPAHIQEVVLGREFGSVYYEQVRLGIIHSSVLEWGAAIKAYTVRAHIDNEGMLPFYDLHLPKFPKTSVIYVSFVY